MLIPQSNAGKYYLQIRKDVVKNALRSSTRLNEELLYTSGKNVFYSLPIENDSV